MTAFHRFKPAPLAAPVEVQVLDERIVQRDSNGRTVANVPVADVSRVRWHQIYANRLLTRRLDLETSAGTLTIHQTTRAAAGPDHPELRGYMAAVRSVLDALAANRPDLEVEQGPPPLLGWLLFAAPLTVSGILLLPLNVLLDRRDAAELWWLGAVLGAAMIGGLVIAWRNRPWRAAPRISTRELASSLTQELAASA